MVRRGELIRLARREAGLSQTKLGELLARVMGRDSPYSQASISDLERDIPWTVFSVEMAEKIAGILGRSAREFMIANPSSVLPTLEAVRAKSRVLTLGTADHVELSLRGPAILTFLSGDRSYTRKVALTKHPAQLAAAMGQALATEGIFGYIGENFGGRVCSWGTGAELDFSLVAEFGLPVPAAFMIHVTETQLLDLVRKIMKLGLPLRSLLTD